MQRLAETLLTWLFDHSDVLLQLALRVWNTLEENKKGSVLLSRSQEVLLSY
jgi:hypothetical protein